MELKDARQVAKEAPNGRVETFVGRFELLWLQQITVGKIGDFTVKGRW